MKRAAKLLFVLGFFVGAVMYTFGWGTPFWRVYTWGMCCCWAFALYLWGDRGGEPPA